MRYFIFVFILFFIGCKNEKVPEGVLPVKQMQSVVWDIVRADVLANYRYDRDTSLKRTTYRTDLYQQVFSIHHITKQQFKRSFQYYQLHPTLWQPILDSLYSKASASTTSAPYSPHPLK